MLVESVFAKATCALDLFLRCVDCSRSLHHCCIQELLSLHGFVLMGLRQSQRWSYMVVGLVLPAFVGQQIRSMVAEPVGIQGSRC